MTDKLRELLEDVQTVYEGKGMIVHPNSFDRLRMEVVKLDNINRQQSEQIEKMKCCYNCSKWYDGECEESPKSKTFFCADFKCDKWELEL